MWVGERTPTEQTPCPGVSREVWATPEVTSDLQNTQAAPHFSSLCSYYCCSETHAVYPKHLTVASVHTVPSWVVPTGSPN